MNSESKFINYLRLPTLQQLACTKTAYYLWKHPSLTDMIKNEFFAETRGCVLDKKFNLLLQTANTHLSLLDLPEDLKSLLSNYLNPFAKQLVSWIEKKEDSERYEGDIKRFFHSITKMNSIHWTADGIIDKAKTYEAILNNTDSKELSFEYLERSFLYVFKAICNCCLEDYIFKFWEIMPKRVRDCSFEGVSSHFDNHFVAYWLCTLKKDAFDFIENSQDHHYDKYDSNHSINRNMITLSITSKNVDAFKYFWKKLTREEIESSLTVWFMEYTKSEYLTFDFPEESVIFFFLLSQLTPEKQRVAINSHSIQVLDVLNFVWAWRDLYLRTIDIIINDSDSDSWCTLVGNLCHSTKGTEMVKDVVRRSPAHFHQSFMTQMLSNKRGLSLFWKIFVTHGTEVMKFFVDHVNVEEKKKIIWAFMEEETEEQLCLYERWLCLQNEKFDSIDELLLYIGFDDKECRELRYEFVKLHLRHLHSNWMDQRNFNSIDKFLNWGCSGQQALIQDVKNNMDKRVIMARLMCEKNVEHLDKFVNWCFSSAEDIIDFKRKCAYSEHDRSSALSILKRRDLSSDRWDRFLRYVFWCLPSDEEVEKLQVFLTRSPQLPFLLFQLIINEHSFDLCDKVLLWCLKTDEKVRMYKEAFLSEYGTSLFCIFTLNPVRRFNNYESVRKLSIWLHPVSIAISDTFKNDLTEKIQTSQFNRSIYTIFREVEEIPLILHVLNIFATDICDDSKSGDINRYVTDLYCNDRSRGYFMFNDRVLFSKDSDLFNEFLMKLNIHDNKEG